jgi:hypothetical protein
MLCHCPVIAAPCGAVPEVCGAAALMADLTGPTSGWRRSPRSTIPKRALAVRAGLARAGRYTWANAGRTLLRLLLEVAR